MIKVFGNQMSSCGSGSTQPFKIQDSSNNEIYNNKLWGDPGNLFDLSGIGKVMVETGSSDNNVYRGNDGVVSLSGRRSRKM